MPQSPSGDIRLAQLPPLKTMADVHFKTSVPPFRGNGGKLNKIPQPLEVCPTVAHHPMHPNRNTPPQCPPCLGELCNHACIMLALIHVNMTHMAPNLLHIVTRLQHEVQDGTGFEPPVALPPHNMGTTHCNNAHQLGMQLRCFKKKRREVLMSRVICFSFEGARITLSATGMCFASCRRLEMKWDTARRARGEPHVRALSLRRFPMPLPTLAQQCATSPTLRTGGMQDIRDPMRGSTGKSAIENKWDRNWSYLRLQFQHFPHEPDII